MENYQHTQLYKKVTGIADIPAADMDKLFATVGARQIKKGENLLSDGQVCKYIFFVEKGYLRTFINKDGIEINTAFTFENDFATDLKSLRGGTPSEATIYAQEDTTCYTFEKTTLPALYKDAPAIETFGRRLLEELLLLQEQHANLFKLYTPAERYKYLLQHEPAMIQRASLSHIASYLGMARETLSRIRKMS